MDMKLVHNNGVWQNSNAQRAVGWLFGWFCGQGES